MVVVQILVTGIGATLVMDLWSLFQKHMLKIAPLNYALVGRWALWLWRGKVRHKTICVTLRYMESVLSAGYAII